MREKRKTRSLGLTLVEMMVTVALAGVVVGGVYMIYQKSVLSYRVESQILDMQDRLRFGLEHVKRDLRRAAFLATPNSETDQNLCGSLTYHLRAVTLEESGDVYEPFSGANPNIDPHALTLFGDFFSGHVYRTSGIVGDRVYLDPAQGNLPSSELEFNRIFSANRYLRIVTREQYELMIPITGGQYVANNTYTIFLAQTVPQMGPDNMCGVAGFGEGLEVNVAGFVRYRIATDNRDNAQTGKTDLIRETLALDGATILTGTQLVVADYAVDLQFYDFAFDTSAKGVIPQIQIFPLLEDVVNDATVNLGKTNAATPELLRALSVKLTVRSQDEDTEFAYTPREDPNDPVVGFEVSEMNGAARTLSLGCRVGLSSLVARNEKPGT